MYHILLNLFKIPYYIMNYKEGKEEERKDKIKRKKRKERTKESPINCKMPLIVKCVQILDM